MLERDVFVYHLDNELQKLFTLHRYDAKVLQSEFSLITKIAFLLCKEKILLPASNYFESDLCFNIINELSLLNEIGAIHFVSSSQNINELLSKKTFQHGESISLPNYHYIDYIDNNDIVLPGRICKRRKSASLDIKSAWHSLANDNVAKCELFGMINHSVNASKFDDILHDVPRQLGDKAYISNYILPLLPFEQEYIQKADYFLNAFITKNYIASFLNEYNAACLCNIPFIDSSVILPDNPNNKYCFISYSRIKKLLLTSKYKNNDSLAFVKHCNAYELIEFKDSYEWQSMCMSILYNKPNDNINAENVRLFKMNNYDDIKIGVITALPMEYAAMKVMMKEPGEHYFEGKGAGHRFCIGEISSANGKYHRVVLALCGMGNNSAAIRATNVLNHFPSIEALIMTGIAGGIPSYKKDNNQVRLGDIIVSEGIIQYDYIKESQSGFECRSKPPKPSPKLIEAVQFLKTYEYEGKFPWHLFIDQMKENPLYSKPSIETDLLYDQDNNLCQHPEDITRTQYPKVFFGEIASANILLKNPIRRDELKSQYNVLGVEMEASGIADAAWDNDVGYLVVRGICDYCDMHKNDLWQQYAALVAAAYTRAVIETLPCFEK